MKISLLSVLFEIDRILSKSLINAATFLNRFRLPKDALLRILAEIMTFIHYREGFDRLYF